MLQNFFRWPDQLSQTPLTDSLAESARLLRLQHFKSAEALLLATLRTDDKDNFQSKILLIFLRLRFAQLSQARSLLEQLKAISPAAPEICFLEAQFSLQTLAIENLHENSQNLWRDLELFWPLKLCKAAFSLHINQLDLSQAILDSIPEEFQDTLEVIRLRCRLLSRRFLYREALELMVCAVDRFPNHLPANVHLLNLTYQARSQEQTLPRLRKAIAIHGRDAEFLAHIAKVQMLQHQLADARRTCLQERCWQTVRPVSAIASTNLFNNYERLGYVDWLNYIAEDDIKISVEMRENLIMQFASFESDKTGNQVQKLLPELKYQLKQFGFDRVWKPPVKSGVHERQLTIAWLSGDIGYHPVSRFLLGFFSSYRSPIHRHILIDTNDQLQESNRNLFESLPHISVCNLGTSWWPDMVPLVRKLEPDIAIDLSGWTGGHFARGFLSRIAELQVNYLGYFGSTGLPSMDYWVGDYQLFPKNTIEWHSEQLHRLNRCFIAWEPPPSLPEATLDVTDAPSGGIRFGSFNHNRKLSDETLELWAKIFATLPSASLVLKASNKDDKGTQELLCRRMRRQGLDPERVIWLPRAPSATEHLHQYQFVDVVLDCFPNGGCTTTCEALWMGTPVITLAGNSYVSRMSTAVLAGAGLSQWSVNTKQAYLDLAVSLADCLRDLRQQRDQWRNKIKTNELGDASGLMLNLENSLKKLYWEKFEK